MDLPRLGVFAFLDHLGGAEAIACAREVERLGYGVLWLVEGIGRDAFVHAGILLAHTDRLIVGSGVASVWTRNAAQCAAAARTLAESSGGRFVLGLGVNNPLSGQVRGFRYDQPVRFMREYLTEVGSAAYGAPAPTEAPPVVVAANRPRMARVAAERARGTITYLAPVEHTRRVRAWVGPDAWLCAEQAVLLETDPGRARAAARTYLSFYLPRMETYVATLREHGFGDADLQDGLSDRLVDALVAWGDVAALRARVEAHFAAGASHVCAMALGGDGSTAPHMPTLTALAAAMA